MKGYYFRHIIWDIGCKRPTYNGEMTKRYNSKIIECGLPGYYCGFYLKANSVYEAERLIEEKFGVKMMFWCISQFEITSKDEIELKWLN